MKKQKKEQYIKIFKIVLIIIWMATVFHFSNEGGQKSEGTSRKVSQTIINTISGNKNMKNETVLKDTDKLIRKLAHYTIYTIGGILIISYMMNTTDKTLKDKILYSIILGGGYAITDEIHQLFVGGRSARIFDVGIDILGVITGIIIYLSIINYRESKLKE